MKNFFIKNNYTSRKNFLHYDDTKNTDGWQKEVYLEARSFMQKHDLNNVIDIGCGSGYKLVKYFKEYNTTGLEVECNLDFLNSKYPSHQWLKSDFNNPPNLETDIVICADVIEHLINPDMLMEYIKTFKFKFAFISTPDRDLHYHPNNPGYNGPPGNKTHIREWNSSEFNQYISSHLKVIDHKITNRSQSTQLIICTEKTID